MKFAVNQGQKRIKIALAIDRYSEFVKSSFPDLRYREKPKEVVNGIDSHVRKVLRQVFGLADNQQKEFWSEIRYASWAQRTGSAFTLADIKESLADIKL